MPLIEPEANMTGSVCDCWQNRGTRAEGNAGLLGEDGSQGRAHMRMFLETTGGVEAFYYRVHAPTVDVYLPQAPGPLVLSPMSGVYFRQVQSAEYQVRLSTGVTTGLVGAMAF